MRLLKNRSATRRKLQNHHSSNTIQIAPFVDVVLVLLITFMIAAPVALYGIDVTLPSGHQEIEDTNYLSITISCKQDNTIYIDDQLVSAVNLIKAMRNKTKGNHGAAIFIRSDKSVAYGRVLGIIDILHRAGYYKAILVTEALH